MRTSLYADDAALFVRPTIQDVNNVQHILAAFGSATRLKTNLQKSELLMIQTREEEKEIIAAVFQDNIGQFPANSLGLPLHIGRTTRAAEQGRLLNWAGQLTGKFSPHIHTGVSHDILFTI
jgi:3-deoxy-D-manno-octulosonic-acid transferase